MAQRTNRIACPRCGANNFDTVTSCWKCGAPVGSGAQSPAQAPPMQATMPQAYAPAPSAPSYAPAPTYTPERVPSAPAITGDTGAAKRAALALALTLPFIGLPVGWIFMMIEDRRKQEIGRWCANWSMLGLVAHLLLTYLAFQAAVPLFLRAIVPLLEAAAKRGGGGEGLPGGF